MGPGEEERNCCLSENLKEKMEETVPLRRTVVPKRYQQRGECHPCSPLSFCSHFCTRDCGIQVIDPKSLLRDVFSSVALGTASTFWF